MRKIRKLSTEKTAATQEVGTEPAEGGLGLKKYGTNFSIAFSYTHKRDNDLNQYWVNPWAQRILPVHVIYNNHNSH